MVCKAIALAFVLPASQAAVLRSNTFLAAEDSQKLQPEVVANTLAKVQDEWKQQATAFIGCTSKSGKDCNEAHVSFDKSCATVVNAVVQGSGGDRLVAKDYFGTVCNQKQLAGWRKLRCSELATALVDHSMTADKYANRESFKAGTLCSSFWTKFVAEEQKREEQEAKERAEREKREAEARAKAEAEAKKKAEEEAKAKAKAEAEHKAKEEERRIKEEKERVQREKEEKAKKKAAEAKARAAEAAKLLAQKKAEAEAVQKAAEQKLKEAAEAEKEHLARLEENKKAEEQLKKTAPTKEQAPPAKATVASPTQKQEPAKPVEKAAVAPAKAIAKLEADVKPQPPAPAKVVSKKVEAKVDATGKPAPAKEDVKTARPAKPVAK